MHCIAATRNKGYKGGTRRRNRREREEKRKKGGRREEEKRRRVRVRGKRVREGEKV